jgi:hypothetical protein
MHACGLIETDKKDKACKIIYITIDEMLFRLLLESNLFGLAKGIKKNHFMKSLQGLKEL